MHCYTWLWALSVVLALLANCSVETRLALHIPSSQLENIITVVVVVVDVVVIDVDVVVTIYVITTIVVNIC